MRSSMSERHKTSYYVSNKVVALSLAILFGAYLFYFIFLAFLIPLVSYNLEVG